MIRLRSQMMFTNFLRTNAIIAFQAGACHQELLSTCATGELTPFSDLEDSMLSPYILVAQSPAAGWVLHCHSTSSPASGDNS